MSGSASSTLITCIYCKKIRPPSREHILARSIGGDATAPITCIPCNGGPLSEIDQALAERSFVSLPRVAYTPPGAFPVQLGSDVFLYDDRQTLERRSLTRLKCQT
jgi:hypothetical protein